MKEKSDELNLPDSQAGKKEEKTLKGYPIYPGSEDIYKKFQEEEDLNPENTSKTKVPNSDNVIRGKYLDEAHRKNDLDIPGAEFDDRQEDIGSEDEENNYYSLGGDDHNDLDENKGE